MIIECLWESSKKEFQLDQSTEEDFSKKLLELAAVSPDIYGDIRRMSGTEALSSVRLFFNELKANIGSASLNNNDDSSEDEGEIKEDD